jgi:hypothetical protein
MLRYRYLPLFLIAILSVLTLVMVACQADGDISTEVEAPTSEIHDVPLESSTTIESEKVAEVVTASPSSTQTQAVPMPTEMIPSATAPAPILDTATAEPPTTTPAPEATPTMPIPGLIGPDNFPDNVNPLTGETVVDLETLQRRPIAIKVSNIVNVRPQSGLNSADIIFEHLTEGGITRLTAVFYTYDIEKVGSIRSGRLIDMEIPIMYDAAFAYSGSSGPVRLMFRDSTFFDRIISPDFAHGGFERIEDTEGPSQRLVDTLFTNIYTLRWILEERGQEVPPDFENGMAFHPDPPEGGSPASEIEVFYGATSAFWFFNPQNERYTRWSDGEAHLDANTGQQLNFKNIMVLGANHVNTDILEDTGGSPSIEIQIWGQGPISLFRDGQRFEGQWKREDPSHMLTFYDLNGRILPLAPGNTFIQVVPLGFEGLSVDD